MKYIRIPELKKNNQDDSWFMSFLRVCVSHCSLPSCKVSGHFFDGPPLNVLWSHPKGFFSIPTCRMSSTSLMLRNPAIRQQHLGMYIYIYIHIYKTNPWKIMEFQPTNKFQLVTAGFQPSTVSWIGPEAANGLQTPTKTYHQGVRGIFIFYEYIIIHCWYILCV